MLYRRFLHSYKVVRIVRIVKQQRYSGVGIAMYTLRCRLGRFDGNDSATMRQRDDFEIERTKGKLIAARDDAGGSSK